MRREPMFNLPAAVVACIGVLLAVHGVRSMLPSETDLRLLLDLSFVPGRWTVAWNPARLSEALGQAAQAGPGDPALRAAFARFILGQPEPGFWSFASYALLHGSWAHVLLNGLWLAAFGTPVARRCGSWRLIALGLAAAVGGALAHWFAHPLSVAPMIGASAAVSGLMAAAARFMFGSAQDPEGSHRGPRQSLLALLGNRRAAAFLGLWFVTNLMFGLMAVPLGVVDAGIAWEAHLGGFAAGLLLFPLLDRNPSRPVDPRPQGGAP